jgi:hypothetical protein
VYIIIKAGLLLCTRVVKDRSVGDETLQVLEEAVKDFED